MDKGLHSTDWLYMSFCRVWMSALDQWEGRTELTETLFNMKFDIALPQQW